MTDDLAAWLLEQIAQDEQRARNALRVSNERFATGDLPFWERRYHVITQINERTPEGDTLQQRQVADCGNLNLDVASHILHWEPARVLAECDAKRQVINDYLVNDADATSTKDDFKTRVARINAAVLYRSLQFLALPYADRPGYREEWRP